MDHNSFHRAAIAIRACWTEHGLPAVSMPHQMSASRSAYWSNVRDLFWKCRMYQTQVLREAYCGCAEPPQARAVSGEEVGELWACQVALPPPMYGTRGRGRGRYSRQGAGTISNRPAPESEMELVGRPYRACGRYGRSPQGSNRTQRPGSDRRHDAVWQG